MKDDVFRKNADFLKNGADQFQSIRPNLMTIKKKYYKLLYESFSSYIERFTQQFSSDQHYNFKNPGRLLSNIKHEFPKQYLRYKFIYFINETLNQLLEMIKTLSQKNYINFVRLRLVTAICKFLICHALIFILLTMC